MNIYIAGPFSNPECRESLLHMIDLVKRRYTGQFPEIYIPMEFKVPGDFQKPDGTWNLANHEWARKVYEADLEHLKNADIVFAMNIGIYRTAGTVWEMGYAKGKNIPVIAYIPDWAKNNDMSLMLMNSFDGYLTEDCMIKPFTIDEFEQYNQK